MNLEQHAQYNRTLLKLAQAWAGLKVTLGPSSLQQRSGRDCSNTKAILGRASTTMMTSQTGNVTLYSYHDA